MADGEDKKEKAKTHKLSLKGSGKLVAEFVGRLTIASRRGIAMAQVVDMAG